MSDAGYRTQEEINAWKGRDPIKLFRETILTGGYISPADLDAVDAEVKAQIEAAVAFAESSPLPDPATVADHVYSTGACLGVQPAEGGQHA